MKPLYIFTYDLLAKNDQGKEKDAMAAVRFDGKTLIYYGPSKNGFDWLDSYKLLSEIDLREDDFAAAIAHPLTGLYSFAVPETGPDAERLFQAIAKRFKTKHTSIVDEIEIPSDLPVSEIKKLTKIRTRLSSM